MSDAEQFLQQIGFDNSHLPSIFNDDDKSFYTIAELIQEYADQEVERYKRENTRNILLDFADYNESDKVSTTTDEVVDNYLDEVKTNKR